jgi:outer membrane receptor protein involved in Fe transport
MRALILLSICLGLSGCATVLSGAQSTGGGVTTTTTSAATHIQASGGQAQFNGAFGTPPAPGASGNFLSLSRSSTAWLLLGLVIGDALNLFGSSVSGPPPSAPRRDSIAETCSCYGWKPGSAVAPKNE